MVVLNQNERKEDLLKNYSIQGFEEDRDHFAYISIKV